LVIAIVFFAGILLGVIGVSLFPPQHYIWSKDMTNKVDAVVIRPYSRADGFLPGECETVTWPIRIDDHAIARKLAVEMTGSKWDKSLWEDQYMHWVVLKKVFLDFECGTQHVTFIVGLHFKYPLAQANELCQEGSFYSTGDSYFSHKLYILLSNIIQSNGVSWKQLGGDPHN